jgi:1-acyl-sn-glycerol-3-phosphate acyltransferase
MAEPVYTAVASLVRGWFKVLDVSLDVAGAENVPRSGGVVLACNHISPLDALFVGVTAYSCGRHLRVLTKDSLFRHRIVGPLLRTMKQIPVDRDAGAAGLESAVETLRSGEAVLVFPEATLSRSFELKEFKTGAVRMACSAGVPVVPMAQWGQQRLATYDKRSSMRQRGVPVVVRIGEPVDPAGDPHEATARLSASMRALLADARAAYPTDGNGQWWQPVALGGTAPTPEEALALEAAASARRAAKQG